jgi:hypothetical protein
MTRGRRRSLLITSGLVALVFATAAIFAVHSRSSGRTSFSDGPLYTDDVDVVGIPTAVGADFTYALVVVHNRSTKPLTLDSVALYRPTHGLEVRGSFVLGPRRHLWAFSGDYGPLAAERRIARAGVPIRPVHAYVLAPDSVGKPHFGAELVLLARATGRGHFRTSGVIVTYHQSRKRYRELLPRVLVVCAPPQKITGHCSDGTPLPVPRSGSVGRG